MGALLELLVGGLADEDGPVVLGLHLDLQDVGGDVAAKISGFDSGVDTLQTKKQNNSFSTTLV